MQTEIGRSLSRHFAGCNIMSGQIHILKIEAPEWLAVDTNEKFTYHAQCPICHGKGKITSPFRDDDIKECSTCKGTGKVRAEIKINWVPDI
jgi:hypothetical protein